jgi:hypothetical protein
VGTLLYAIEPYEHEPYGPLGAVLAYVDEEREAPAAIVMV